MFIKREKGKNEVQVIGIRIHKINNYNPAKTIKLNVNSYVGNVLIYLDRFLIYLEEHKKHVLSDFLAELKLKYRAEVPYNFNKLDSLDLSEIIPQLKVLKDPDLLETVNNLILTLLNVPEGYAWESQEIDIVDVNITKARVVPIYYCSKLLTELIDREEAIQLLKDYFEFYIHTYRNVKKYENLTSIYEASNNQNNTILVNVLINDGIYAGKGGVCAGHEALKGFNDPELAYIICCHGDAALIRKYNENFVMTRRYTLMDGPYCDTTAHDTRIVTKIEHPSEEFFDNLDWE
ncbi:MAG: hypothetical protein ACFFBD_30025 [Candidatus Hodarchaeota archaeon]